MNNEWNRTDIGRRGMTLGGTALAASTGLVGSAVAQPAQAQTTSAATSKRPNIVMLMTDDTGWNDFGCLFRWRRHAWSSNAECRSHRRGRRDLHLLVWPGELHRGPRFVPHRALSDPLGAFDCGGAGRPELSAQGNADHCRVLSEERLHDLFLRQMAHGRQAGGLSDRARLRPDEAFCSILCRVLCLRQHNKILSPMVPEIQRRIHENTTAL